MADFRNLVVYMSDGVRWDSHPNEIRELGATWKTISASLHTPSSIASMLTGVHLPKHGVRGFTDSLGNDRPTVLDLFPNRGLSDSSGNFNNEIYRFLLERYDAKPLSEMNEPFGWFMRDAGGHAPYDGFDETLQTNESVDSYLEKHAGDDEQMRRDYEAGIQASADRFRRFVLEPLEERGIRDETLIVFISDHGQMLGEHGHVGESYPACPEIVYVPTTFIHPDLPTGKQEGLFRHVDLLDTMAGLVDPDTEVPPTDGLDIFSADESPSYGLNFYDRPYPSIRGEFSYTIKSVWDADGGHAFIESGLFDKVRLTTGLLSRIPAGKQLRRTRSLASLKLLFDNQQTWGTPSFSVAEARTILDEYDVEIDSQSLDLDDSTVDNLEDLGYL